MKSSSTNPYISLLKTAWKYARKERSKYLLVYSMFIVSNLISSFKPVLWGIFINQLQKDGANALSSAWKYVGAYVLLYFLDWCMHGPARVIERKLAFNLSRNFLQELYHKTVQLPVKWHQDHHSGATINRVRKAYEALRDFFQDGFMYLQALSKFIFSFIAILYFSPTFGGIAVLLGVGVVAVIFIFDKPYIRTLDEVNEREHVVSSTLFDSLSNIVTVITLRLQGRMEHGLMNKVDDIYPPFHKNVLVNEWKWFVVDMSVAVIYSIILVGYMYQNWQPGQVFLIGGLVTLIGYVGRFTDVFHNIAWQYSMIVKYDTDVKTAQGLLEAYNTHHLPETKAVLPANWNQIDIQDLHFTHNETRTGENMAQGLHSIVLKLERGKRIAFIGESGSGKSTLLALLRGLYAPEPGAVVKIDGQPEADGLVTVSNHVTLCPQEPEIFENTIAYNITLGLPFSSADIDKVCEMAHFSEVVQQLPKGLESNIQEKGVNLSGGQKQRLALARGILAARDSDILLLDEPTSSVDPKTEAKIYEKLFADFSDKLIVSSLHRLHLLSRFDYVYVMEQGRIVDEGTFAYLRANSSIFQELWQHQEEVSVQ